MTVAELVQQAEAALQAAGVHFGHGTTNAWDEAAWLVLWRLGLPLDALDAVAGQDVAPVQAEQVRVLVEQRIATRKPAAYLTGEAWLQGVPFFVDERVIVPRSLIAEPLAEGSIDVWLSERTKCVLDLCTGNGSLAVLAALAWPAVTVDATDISADALAVAARNVQRHGLAERITLLQGDGLAAVAGRRYDLILCNPPYVNRQSMAALPAEFRAEPALALDGNVHGGDDGMDFIRRLLADVPAYLNDDAVLVLEIGHERPHFEAAFPLLDVVWLSTSAGDEQVLLVTAEALRAQPIETPMIQISQVTLRRGVKVVLQNASVTLQPREKVGLIGRNGAGKSSLFSLLTHRLQSDAGDVDIPPRWRVGEVAQDVPETEDGATDFVLQGDLPLLQAQRALEAAEAADDGHAMADAHQALDEAGAFDARARAQALLMGLGFRGDQLDAPVNTFSGGWRMRLQLARALMCPSDLLLLDEPTNHLDLDALVWLEAWLKRYDGLMVVISHDREFLDAICNVIVHLDELQLTRYTGNYTAFEEMRAERITQAQAAFSKQQDRVAHLQKFIDRFKAKASKAKQAQSRVKALARMERLAPVMTAGDFNFEFREPLSLPNPMLSFDGISCGYNGVPIVKNFSRSVLAGQRIGILGANGQGKSTLVKTIAGDLPLISGHTTQGKGLVIGYFAQQELDVLQLDDGPLMHMVRLARDVGPPAREQELRDFLGSFRFVGAMVQQAVGSLSGGEKARLVLAMLVWQRPNLLLMDEPTNHLDLTTREALSIALNEFEGTVMLVSHDRALLRETCDEFWLVAKGRVEPFDGDLDDYQKWLLEVSRANARGQPLPDPPRSPSAAAAAPEPAPPAAKGKATAPAKAATPAPAIQAPKPATPKPASRDERQSNKAARIKQAEATRPLRNELQRIDERLAKLGKEKAEIEAALSRPDASADAYAELGRRLAHVAAEVAMLEERWVEVQTELEAMPSA